MKFRIFVAFLLCLCVCLSCAACKGSDTNSEKASFDEAAVSFNAVGGDLEGTWVRDLSTDKESFTFSSDMTGVHSVFGHSYSFTYKITDSMLYIIPSEKGEDEFSYRYSVSTSEDAPAVLELCDAFGSVLKFTLSS